MLQIAFIRENSDAAVEGLKRKYFPNPEQTVAELLKTDEERRSFQAQRDQMQAEAKKASKEIGSLMKQGKKEEAEQAKKDAAAMRDKVKEMSDKVEHLSESLTQQLYQIPNLPHPSVPPGKSPDDNVVVKQGGEIPELAADAKPHWELIEQYSIIDFNLGNKVTGAGFPFYRGKGARLARAMVNLFLDRAMEAGYEEVQPPILVNEASGYGTGQLPDKEGQMYKLEGLDYYLIPTAEVPITNMFRDIILNGKDFPIKLAGFTPCFRREAGSWGADVRGLNRLHQFDKVEIVCLERPEKSYERHIEMRDHIEKLLQELELPYRILNLCGGDISFNAALCFDLEVYSAAQKKWLEVSSVSNFEAFQANRSQVRYRDEENKIQLAHTLNGSALALPRILAAILENNQSAEGIKIPKVLQPYCGFDLIV